MRWVGVCIVVCLLGGVVAKEEPVHAESIPLALQPPVGQEIPWVWEEEYTVTERPHGTAEAPVRQATVVFRFVADVIFERTPQGFQVEVRFRRPSVRIKNISGQRGWGFLSECEMFKTGTSYHLRLDRRGAPQDLIEARAMLEELQRVSPEIKSAGHQTSWLTEWLTSTWAVTFGYHQLWAQHGVEPNTTSRLVTFLRHRLPGFGTNATFADAVPLTVEFGLTPASIVERRMSYPGWYRFAGTFPVDPTMRHVFNSVLHTTFPFMVEEPWEQGELRGGGTVVIDKDTQLPLAVSLRHRLVLIGMQGEEVRIERTSKSRFELSSRGLL